MRYPVAVWSENGAFSATVPDLPGVITEADTIADLAKSVVDAASRWIDCELDDGRAIPNPTSIENYLSNDEYTDCTWMLVDIDSFSSQKLRSKIDTSPVSGLTSA